MFPEREIQYKIEKEEIYQTGKFLSIKEAALIYSFEIYINAFVDASQGKMYREADAGLGKNDLVVNLHSKEYLF